MNIILLENIINLGTGEDVANCAAFLASDMAKYINGETVMLMVECIWLDNFN